MTNTKIVIDTCKKNGEVKTRITFPGKKKNLNKMLLESPQNDLLGHIENIKDMLQFYFKNQNKNK